MVLKYLIEKEFKQMRRNPIIPRLILVFPCMMMILMPWAANLEIKYNNLAVVDLDHSALSRRLVEKVASTDYFNGERAGLRPCIGERGARRGGCHSGDSA